MMWRIHLIFLILICYLSPNISSTKPAEVTLEENAYRIKELTDNSATLLITTIDGSLIAIDAQTGADKWQHKEGPLIESPVNVQRGFTFIPDPRDGQLYLVIEGRLSKLPFTIPHLVRVSPCKSSDGVFYAGNKKDMWISVNLETGERMDFFGTPTSKTCPASHAKMVHIGRTEYQIKMMDTKNRDRHWNATFVDYSAHLLPEDTRYPLQHFTSSADGRILTVDSHSGFVLWQRDFSNVIVNMYLLKSDGMHRLPSKAIGQETFELLAQSVVLNPLIHAPAELPDRLLPTLYVGETPQVGLYALPAYVDKRTNQISQKYLGPPLLEGPKATESGSNPTVGDQHPQRDIIKRQLLPPNTVGLTYTTKDGEYLLLGYHEMPKTLSTSGDFYPMASPNNPTPSNAPIIVSAEQKRAIEIETIRANAAMNINNAADRIPQISSEMHEQIHSQKQQIFSHLSHLMMPILIIAIIFVISWWFFFRSQYYLSQRSRTMSSGSTLSTITEIFGGDASRSSKGSVHTAYEPDELPLGWHRINNSSLSYNTSAVLGRGCEGTIVFIGKFDDREVAVKRIVSANLDRGLRQHIEREVIHLRQSDSHPNVIRYFCSEIDNHFYYIALELCDMTLDDYIHQRIDAGNELSRKEKLDLMKQTADGIAHLHHINIIHRDVKPKNILLGGIHQNRSGMRIQVKISDFGLCKTVKLGHNSISKVSGVVGTEGWMAPELFSPDKSVTYAVDVFSLGCVFYYVLTNGQHPFGESLSRMSNIKFGIFSLDMLDEQKDSISRSLIESMIRANAKERPPSSVVAGHPFFWEPAKQLQFLMEVSDWIEKKDMKDPVMRRLEWRRNKVIGNWLDSVDEILKNDLLKQRTYTNNMRDLLRAIRNKKHHYQELSVELRKLLGPIPNDFLAYFTSRFPKLLLHSFIAVVCIGDESAFQEYYSAEQLRDFYEHERAVLFRLEPAERRSISPVNWRMGNPKQSTLGITTTLTTESPTLAIAAPLQQIFNSPPPLFDPSIPPPLCPPNFTNQIMPVGKQQNSVEKEEEMGQKEVLPIQSNIIIPASVVLSTTQKKKIKPKKSRKQKEKKAPYSILASNELGEEEDAKEKESQISEGEDIDKGDADEGRERSI